MRPGSPPVCLIFIAHSPLRDYNQVPVSGFASRQCVSLKLIDQDINTGRVTTEIDRQLVQHVALIFAENTRPHNLKHLKYFAFNGNTLNTFFQQFSVSCHFAAFRFSYVFKRPKEQVNVLTIPQWALQRFYMVLPNLDRGWEGEGGLRRVKLIIQGNTKDRFGQMLNFITFWG